MKGKYSDKSKNPNVNEYRGDSWSIGCGEDAMTLPNILKHYNKDLKGCSIGHHAAEVNYLDTHENEYAYPSMDNLNGAQSGGMAAALPSYKAYGEVSYLEERYLEMLKEDPNLQSKWKLINVLIGANDMCLSCLDKYRDVVSPKVYQENLNATVGEIYKVFPNTIVSLVEIFKVSEVFELGKKKFQCRLIHLATPFECKCAFAYFNGDVKRSEMDAIAKEYNEAIRNVAAYWNGKKSKTFGVTVVPMFKDAKLSDFNIDMVSSVDCFHPSQRTHGYMAIHLWNSLLTKPEERKSEFNLLDDIICPNENSKIYI